MSYEKIGEKASAKAGVAAGSASEWREGGSEARWGRGARTAAGRSPSACRRPRGWEGGGGGAALGGGSGFRSGARPPPLFRPRAESRLARPSRGRGSCGPETPAASPGTWGSSGWVGSGPVGPRSFTIPLGPRGIPNERRGRKEALQRAAEQEEPGKPANSHVERKGNAAPIGL
jgi:hypothetical protein